MGGFYSLPFSLMSLHTYLPQPSAHYLGFLSSLPFLPFPSLWTEAVFSFSYLSLEKIQGWGQMKERKELADRSLPQAAGRGKDDL